MTTVRLGRLIFTGVLYQLYRLRPDSSRGPNAYHASFGNVWNVCLSLYHFWRLIFAVFTGVLSQLYPLQAASPVWSENMFTALFYEARTRGLVHCAVLPTVLM